MGWNCAGRMHTSHEASARRREWFHDAAATKAMALRSCRRRSSESSSSCRASTSEKSLAAEVQDDFVLVRDARGELVYFDNAATSHKPGVVLDAVRSFYERENSNVHRGVHALSVAATERYERARASVARFINCRSPMEPSGEESSTSGAPAMGTTTVAPADGYIVFTRGATEAINLVANAWAATALSPGDEIVLSVAEHHSNIVPWQMVAARTGAVLRFVPLERGNARIDMHALREMVSSRTRLIALPHVSNVLGSLVDVQEVVAIARSQGAAGGNGGGDRCRVLLDACQSVPHMPVDVAALGVDWLVASGHKMCAPTGIGFLFGTAEVMDGMGPFMGGGEMIADVHLEHSTYAPPPARFEAGTPAIAEAVGLGEACEYLTRIGMDRVHAYESELARRLYDSLAGRVGVSVYGPSEDRAALCAFNVDGVHASDIAAVLDVSGVAIRSGHHCCQPLHRALGVSASARASLHFYNTDDEVDVFAEKLDEAVRFFTSPSTTTTFM